MTEAELEAIAKDAAKFRRFNSSPQLRDWANTVLLLVEQVKRLKRGDFTPEEREKLFGDAP